ncbi:MAG: hypothetical protein EXS16_21855 [Gemmataceae bacterium]|nr:hypothetical protein [Gemmataceae bacterium]
MDIHAEFERLLGNLLDGPTDSRRNDQLCALLAEHPVLEREYVDYLQLHALLHWRVGLSAPSVNADDHAMILPMPVAQPGPVERRSNRWRAWSLSAAMTFFAATLAIVMLVGESPSRASVDVVDRLIDWNIALTQAESPKDRDRIYTDQAETIKASLASANLRPEDRVFAEKLLETGVWLKQTDDPVAEYGRISDLADQVVARLDVASQTQDAKQVTKLANALDRIEAGVDATFERAVTSNVVSKEGKKKLAHATLGGALRMKKLETILENNLDPPRKAIHRTLKGRHKAKKLFRMND